MTHCPHCDEDIEVPDGEMIRLDEFFTEDAGDIDVSVQKHIQLECPECGAVLGYLGLGAAAGG
jgi:hypothetical protein